MQIQQCLLNSYLCYLFFPLFLPRNPWGSYYFHFTDKKDSSHFRHLFWGHQNLILSQMSSLYDMPLFNLQTDQAHVSIAFLMLAGITSKPMILIGISVQRELSAGEAGLSTAFISLHGGKGCGSFCPVRGGDTSSQAGCVSREPHHSDRKALSSL